MKKLVVHNFGPIKDVQVELRDINIFIGEQSVGKSVLAKLITILTDHISLLSIIKNDNVEWYKWLKRYNLDIYKEDSYKILYEVHEDELSFHFEINSSAIIMYMVMGGKTITDKELIFEEFAGTKKIYHNEAFDRYIASLETNDNNSKKELGNLFNNSLYIPAERIIYSVVSNLWPAFALASSSISGNLLKFMVELNNAKSEYPEFYMPILGVSYKKEGGDDYFVISNDGKKFPVSVASSGIQSTMPLLLVIHYAIKHKEYSTFVIEEPECNLFPSKQVELLEYILNLIKSEDRTLTITTHSPYILSAMNNYLFAGSIKKLLNIKKKELGSLNGKMCVLQDECSVYSIGESINGEGVYCKSLMDGETGMIDFNSLDSISNKLGVEFEELEDLYAELLMN